MRKIFLLLFFATSTALQAQVKDTITISAPSSQDLLLKKSSRQKTGGLLLLTTGSALIIISMAIAIEDLGNSLDCLLCPDPPPQKDHSGTITVLAITGAAAIIASVPMLVAARKNKKAAVRLSFINQHAEIIVHNRYYRSSIPSMALTFHW